MDKSERPTIHINMVMTLDGKITSKSHDYIKLGSSHDWKLMNKIRAFSDAVIIGANTIRIDDPPLIVRDKKLVKRRCEEGKEPHPINIVVSSDLNIPLEGKFFNFAKTKKIIFCSQQADKNAINNAKKYAEVNVFGKERVDLLYAIKYLKQINVDNLLIEGGGDLNFSFLKLGVVDRVYLTLTPYILGGKKATTWVEGEGFNFEDIMKLSLSSFERVEDEFFLSYDVIYD